MRLFPVQFAIVFSFCVAVTASGTYIPLSEAENPEVPTIAPDKILNLTNHGEPRDIALSTDGESLVYAETILVFDIWATIVSLWPEIILALTLILLLYRLYVTVRQRKRFPNETGPFCAICAYPVRGLDNPVCPECGQSLTDKAISDGVTRFRSITLVLSVTSLMGILLLTYLAIELPRDVKVRHWVSWRSESLASWAQNNQYQLFKDNVRTATAVRSFEIGNPNSIENIASVINQKEFDQGLIPFSTGGWMGYEDMETSLDQKYAGVSTSDYYAVIDLEKVKLMKRGRLKQGVGRSRVSSDATYRFYYRDYSGKRGWVVQEIDGSEERIQASVVDPIVEVPIRARTRYPWLNRNRESLHLFVDSAISLHSYHSGQDSYFEAWSNSPHRLRCSIQAGYLVVMASNTVLLYDLNAAEWIAELEISSVNMAQYASEGWGITISSDRRTAAYLNNSGSLVAIYKLPDPFVP